MFDATDVLHLHDVSTAADFVPGPRQYELAWGVPGTMIVTDRVRQLRDEHGLTNLNLTPVEQVWWDPLGRWEVLDRRP